MEFPESVDPDEYQKLSDKLKMDPYDYEALEIIRRHMRYILSEEEKQKEQDHDNK